MALKTFVKISNVSNLSDARYCAGMGVDVIGFNIDTLTEGHLDPDTFREITEWVAGVQFAGEFSRSGIEEIKEAVRNYEIDLIELQDMALVESVGLLGKPLIYKMDIDSPQGVSQIKSTLSYLDELARFVIFKTEDPELHEAIDEELRYYNGNLKLIRGYGITPGRDLSDFPGLELEATEEERPGFQDYGEIMDVLEELEEF